MLLKDWMRTAEIDDAGLAEQIGDISVFGVRKLRFRREVPPSGLPPGLRRSPAAWSAPRTWSRSSPSALSRRRPRDLPSSLHQRHRSPVRGCPPRRCVRSDRCRCFRLCPAPCCLLSVDDPNRPQEVPEMLGKSPEPAGKSPKGREAVVMTATAEARTLVEAIAGPLRLGENVKGALSRVARATGLNDAGCGASGTTKPGRSVPTRWIASDKQRATLAPRSRHAMSTGPSSRNSPPATRPWAYRARTWTARLILRWASGLALKIAPWIGDTEP